MPELELYSRDCSGNNKIKEKSWRGISKGQSMTLTLGRLLGTRRKHVRSDLPFATHTAIWIFMKMELGRDGS